MKPLLEDSVHISKDEIVRATRYSYSLTRNVETGTSIRRLMDAWDSAKQQNQQAPFTSDFESVQPETDNLMRVDVRSSNPFDFRVLTGNEEQVTTIISMRQIYQKGASIVRKQLFDRLLRVRETVEPSYECILYRKRIEQDWNELVFARLMVPTLGSDQEPEYVFSLTRVLGAPTRLYSITAEFEL